MQHLNICLGQATLDMAAAAALSNEGQMAVQHWHCTCSRLLIRFHSLDLLLSSPLLPLSNFSRSKKECGDNVIELQKVVESFVNPSGKSGHQTTTCFTNRSLWNRCVHSLCVGVWGSGGNLWMKGRGKRRGLAGEIWAGRWQKWQILMGCNRVRPNVC